MSNDHQRPPAKGQLQHWTVDFYAWLEKHPELKNRDMIDQLQVYVEENPGR